MQLARARALASLTLALVTAAERASPTQLELLHWLDEAEKGASELARETRAAAATVRARLPTP